MRKTIYLIRHAKAAGQEPNAALTPEGEQQAIRLAEQLGSLPIERIVSSPYVRAMHTVTPLAQRLGLPITTDDRLVERVLSTTNLSDWMTPLQASFDDLELCLPGGESSRAATERAVAVLNEAMTYPVQTTAIVTHGNLMTLLLKHFNPAIGFREWQQMANPDVYCIEFVGKATTLQRIALASV